MSKQSEQLVGIIEELRAQNEKLTQAVEFHQNDAAQLRKAITA